MNVYRHKHQEISGEAKARSITLELFWLHAKLKRKANNSKEALSLICNSVAVKGASTTNLRKIGALGSVPSFSPSLSLNESMFLEWLPIQSEKHL